jgi:hypothetical protein
MDKFFWLVEVFELFSNMSTVANRLAGNVNAFVFVAELAFRQLKQMLIKNTKVDDKIYCPIYNVKLELKFNDAIS